MAPLVSRRSHLAIARHAANSLRPAENHTRAMPAANSFLRSCAYTQLSEIRGGALPVHLFFPLIYFSQRQGTGSGEDAFTHALSR